MYSPWVLNEKLDYKLEPAEQKDFHELVHQTYKAAIRDYDVERSRQTEWLQGYRIILFQNAASA
jgi:hypothetical protein